ncbi:nuclear transport factor 2 family protein [Arthrobacter sp. NPDC090010]|uniref:nuclear transport factor 2 family protein n=1 Tax=Arthrobacter sp. NPDC090010 TaxID=3363942 RepID=UPI00381BB9F9
MTAKTSREVALDYVRAVGRQAPVEELAEHLAPDFVFREWPNVLSPEAATRDREKTLDGFAQAHLVIGEQRYTIERVVSEGDSVVVELQWEATARMELPYWSIGDRMRARIVSIFTVKDGLIGAQDSFDSYETPA